MVNLEILTDKVIKVIQDSATLCQTNSHVQISPAHVAHTMLGDEKGIAASIIRRANGNLDGAQNAVALILTRQPKQDPPPEARFSMKMNSVMNDAIRRQQKMGDSYVAVDHLFLALLSDIEVGGALHVAGLTLEQAEAAAKSIRGRRKVETKSAEDTFEALSKFGVNMVEMAEKGKLDPVIGRDEEIRRVIQVLCRRTKNNPVLMGEPGVGKTAIVEGLAQRMVRGDVPSSLQSHTLYSLDMGALIAGASFRGEFEERLKAVLNEVKESSNGVILFIDEVHLVMGAGKTDGAMDAANLLKPLLARGALRCIGATTLTEYKKYIEKDAAFERRFQQVFVGEPSVTDTVSILRGLKEKYEAHHGVYIQDGAIVAAATLADRYINDRFLPDKAIDLIDEACANTRVQLNSRPEVIDQLDRRKVQLQIELAALKREKDEKSRERSATAERELEKIEADLRPLNAQYERERGRSNEIRDLKKRHNELRSKLDIAVRQGDQERAADLKFGALPEIERKLQEMQVRAREEEAERAAEVNNNTLVSEIVAPPQVEEVVSRWTGIPTARLSTSERERLLKLKELLGQRVMGQEHAIAAVSEAILRSRAGLAAEDRPTGAFLFLGPTGVGKTQLAKALTLLLFDDEKSLVRIDMSEYMEKHAVSRLIGAPPGYVGHDQGGQLTEVVRRKPFSVILLDEVEKAHMSIWNTFLQVFDDGRLTDGQGRTVDFTNTVIIMTSNIGAEHLVEGAFTSDNQIQPQTEAAVMGCLKEHFRPEFLNRLDDIVMFKPLGNKSMRNIVKIQAEELGKPLKERSIDLNFTDAALDTILQDAWQPEYGARPLRRYLERVVMTAIGRLMLQNMVQDSCIVRVDSVPDSNGGSKLTYNVSGKGGSGSRPARTSSRSREERHGEKEKETREERHARRERREREKEAAAQQQQQQQQQQPSSYSQQSQYSRHPQPSSQPSNQLPPSSYSSSSHSHVAPAPQHQPQPQPQSHQRATHGQYSSQPQQQPQYQQQQPRQPAGSGQIPQAGQPRGSRSASQGVSYPPQPGSYQRQQY